MANSQEVLTGYKKLLSNQKTVIQNKWGIVEFQGNRIDNSTNLIIKSTDISRRSKKLSTALIPKLILSLSTKNNPIYTFNNIDSISLVKEENNVFLSYTDTFQILYKTDEKSFINSSISEINLENATNTEASISSTEGTPAINYNYSEISLLLGFDETAELTGRKSFLRSFRRYSYTEFPFLSDDCTLLMNQIFNKPNNNPDRQAVINSFKSSGLTDGEAEQFYDYIQNVLNILKLYPEVKIRNSTQLSTSTSFLIKNTETDADITIPEPPSFIFDKFLGVSLGTCSTKYSEDFVSYNFTIGRKRQYQLIKEFNEAFVLKTIDFSASTVTPSPPVSPLPYTPNNTGLKINLSPLEFRLIILNEDFQVLQNDNIPSSLTVNVEGKFFYKLTKSSSDYEELKSFSFSFSGGELQGDFIFGDEFIFESPYLAYYLVIDSFEVQI